MTRIVKDQQARWRNARSWAEEALTRARTPQSRQGLLGIYLNDHLAGTTGGAELARRMAAWYPVPGHQAALERLAADIAQDRRTLLHLMALLGMPARHA